MLLEKSDINEYINKILVQWGNKIEDISSYKKISQIQKKKEKCFDNVCSNFKTVS